MDDGLCTRLMNPYCTSDSHITFCIRRQESTTKHAQSETEQAPSAMRSLIDAPVPNSGLLYERLEHQREFDQVMRPG